jgi:ribosomal protein L40E
LNNNSLLILLSVLVFFFVVLPTLTVSIALGGLLWLVAIVMLLWGWAGRQNEIKASRIRRRGELEEEGRQRAMERRGSPPAQIVKETIVTKEVVLIQCRHCGARYPQGTAKCFTCGANL